MAGFYRGIWMFASVFSTQPETKTVPTAKNEVCSVSWNGAVQYSGMQPAQPALSEDGAYGRAVAVCIEAGLDRHARCQKRRKQRRIAKNATGGCVWAQEQQAVL